MQIVKFACGKYGVRTSGGAFVSPSLIEWTGDGVAMFCKMYKWQAKGVIKRSDTTIVEVLDGNK